MASSDPQPEKPRAAQPEVFDPRRFTLRDMSRLGGELRRQGKGARGMHELAGRIARLLYERLRDTGTGTRACALVRFFATQRYDHLDARRRRFAREMLHGEAPRRGLKCLTLLGTAGDLPRWNTPEESSGHLAIPLESPEMVSQAPMISSLLQQLGVRVEELLSPHPSLLVEEGPSSFNVFYVPDALTSPYIPAQRDFVTPHGIRSVLGLGGMLPRGDIFAVILFAKVPIPRESAELFRTLALNVKMAALPFDATKHWRRRETRGGARRAHDDLVLGLRARVATLEQLLEVYERSVTEQSDKLYAEQERMRFQKSLLECQGEASLDGVLSVGTDGTILSANRRLAQMWGIPAPWVGSRSWERVLDGLARRTADPASFSERCDALSTGDEGREEVPLADGRTFDLYTAPIRDAAGSSLGRVWYFRDITGVKEMGRAKDEFIASLSHDLRTPLTSIRGSLGLLARGAAGDLDEEARALVDMAHRNCDRLVCLVNDVLDIGKIEAGRMRFQLETVDLPRLVRHAVEVMQPYGAQLAVGFRIVDEAPGARVRADPDRLLQVLENLLSNAAKFSPAGETVRVTIGRRGPYLRVCVHDRGPGIPPWFQGQIFEKFAQGPTPQTRHEKGTGLGLSISRAIVEGLGGTIGFTSTPGEGASFHFDLPEWQDGGRTGRSP